VPALGLCSLVTAAFIVANLWYKDAIALALLVSTLTALIWYILAMWCLFVLRRREPAMFGRYRAPLQWVLPVSVVLLSGFAAWMYGGSNTDVLPLTAVLYAAGVGYYWIWSRSRIQSAAPEELSARRGL
jgi:amino acid transporter